MQLRIKNKIQNNNNNFLSGYTMYTKRVMPQDVGKYVVYCHYRKGIEPCGIIPYDHDKMTDFSLDIEYAHLSETPRVLSGLLSNYNRQLENPEKFGSYLKNKDGGIYCTARSPERYVIPQDKEGDIVIEYHFQKTERGIVATHAFAFDVVKIGSNLKYRSFITWLSDYSPSRPYLARYKRMFISNITYNRLDTYQMDRVDHRDVIDLMWQYDVKGFTRYEYDSRPEYKPVVIEDSENHNAYWLTSYRARCKIALQSPIDLDNLPPQFKVVGDYHAKKNIGPSVNVITGYLGYISKNKAVYIHVMRNLMYWKYYDYIKRNHPRELMSLLNSGK